MAKEVKTKEVRDERPSMAVAEAQIAILKGATAIERHKIWGFGALKQTLTLGLQIVERLIVTTPEYTTRRRRGKRGEREEEGKDGGDDTGYNRGTRTWEEEGGNKGEYN
ncbi:hypothetical protein EYF80_008971 [Liparis tanakae]|uniref:Uncharacterized protein n=1 Tax=Liparis tanakae TaxID=230148 RepID=A0A4Z2ISJ0_9TELE|nr:hypothetical protein EYF80_008971 [Liparis tanakae]